MSEGQRRDQVLEAIFSWVVIGDVDLDLDGLDEEST